MNIPIAVFDWETYYDPQFSLSKITTEEYIRSDQFETIGCSIWMPTWRSPQWFVGKDVGLFIETHRDELEQCGFLAHNCAFDGAIAAWRYGLHCKMYFDTMGMAQPLFGFTSGVSLAKLLETSGLGVKGDEVVHALGKRLAHFHPTELARYGDYCINDNVGCRKIFEWLLPMTNSKELMAIDEELKCFIDPRIHLDKQVLQDLYDEVVAVKQTNYIWAGNHLGLEPDQVQTAIMSNDKFAALLQELDVDPPTKLSPTTGKKAWAFAKTDDEFTALKEHEDVRVQVLVECRLGGKSTQAETRALRLIQAADRGPFPVMLKHYAAHTGRLGGGDAVNMQNLPRHIYDSTGTLTKRSKLRDALCAPPNHEFVGGDLSQIEARLLAYLAGQDDVTQAFAARDADKTKPDIYCVTAQALLGKVITKEDNPKERQLGKTCRLALGYGMGVDRFIVTARKDGVPLARPLAESLHKKFRDVSPMIVKLWKDGDRALAHLLKGEEWSFGVNGCIVVKADGIHLPSGRVLRYPGLEAERGEYGLQYTYLNRKKRKKIYGAKLIENICQSLAGSVVGDAWLRLRGKMKIVMQVHDELVGLSHVDNIAASMALMKAALTAPVKWLPGIPIACDISHAYRYGEVK